MFHNTGHPEIWLSARPFINMNWTPGNFLSAWAWDLAKYPGVVGHPVDRPAVERNKELTTVAMPELEMEMPWLELMPFMAIPQLLTQLDLRMRSPQLNFTNSSLKA